MCEPHQQDRRTCIVLPVGCFVFYSKGCLKLNLHLWANSLCLGRKLQLYMQKTNSFTEVTPQGTAPNLNSTGWGCKLEIRMTLQTSVASWLTIRWDKVKQQIFTLEKLKMGTFSTNAGTKQVMDEFIFYRHIINELIKKMISWVLDWWKKKFFST